MNEKCLCKYMFSKHKKIFFVERQSTKPEALLDVLGDEDGDVEAEAAIKAEKQMNKSGKETAARTVLQAKLRQVRRWV